MAIKKPNLEDLEDLKPESNKKNLSHQQRVKEIQQAAEIASRIENQNRARSFTIGQSSGGTIEVMLRGDYATLFYILRPVEAVEIIEQLAAAAGIEILKRPKQDFSAWRSWDLEQPDHSDWKGAAPWQLNEKQKKQLAKVAEPYNLLPSSDSIERPKLQASTRRKKSEDSNQTYSGGRGAK